MIQNRNRSGWVENENKARDSYICVYYCKRQVEIVWLLCVREPLAMRLLVLICMLKATTAAEYHSILRTTYTVSYSTLLGNSGYESTLSYSLVHNAWQALMDSS